MRSCASFGSIRPLLLKHSRLVTKDHKIGKRNVHSNCFCRIFPAVIARKGQMVNPLVSKFDRYYIVSSDCHTVLVFLSRSSESILSRQVNHRLYRWLAVSGLELTDTRFSIYFVLMNFNQNVKWVDSILANFLRSSCETSMSLTCWQKNN